MMFYVNIVSKKNLDIFLVDKMLFYVLKRRKMNCRVVTMSILPAYPSLRSAPICNLFGKSQTIIAKYKNIIIKVFSLKVI